jgi:hypothetical protein
MEHFWEFFIPQNNQNVFRNFTPQPFLIVSQLMRDPFFQEVLESQVRFEKLSNLRGRRPTILHQPFSGCEWKFVQVLADSI